MFDTQFYYIFIPESQMIIHLLICPERLYYYSLDHFEPNVDLMSYLYYSITNRIISYPIYHDAVDDQRYYTLSENACLSRVRYMKSYYGIREDILKIVTHNEFVSDTVVSCSSIIKVTGFRS